MKTRVVPDSETNITTRFETVIERAWKNVLQAHDEQFTQTKEAVKAVATTKEQRHQLTMALDGYSEVWNQTLFDAADQSFMAGTVAGLRLGFKLAGLQSMGCGPENNDGDEALPGIPKAVFHMFVSLAMVDDNHGQELVAALIEEESGKTNGEE